MVHNIKASIQILIRESHVFCNFSLEHMSNKTSLEAYFEKKKKKIQSDFCILSYFDQLFICSNLSPVPYLKGILNYTPGCRARGLFFSDFLVQIQSCDITDTYIYNTVILKSSKFV